MIVVMLVVHPPKLAAVGLTVAATDWHRQILVLLAVLGDPHGGVECVDLSIVTRPDAAPERVEALTSGS